MAEEPRKEFEMFMAHLERTTGKRAVPDCPICHSSSWGLEGPNQMSMFDRENESKGLRTSFPVVILLCKRCSYIYSFAWTPIEKDAQANG